MNTRHFCVGLLCVAGGCAVGPNYQTPLTPTPETWSEPPPGGPTTRPAEVATWWETLNDPMLNSLVDRAIKSNLELRVAEARVREGRALRTATAADLWPKLNASGSYAYKGISKNATPKTSSSRSLLSRILSWPVVSILPGEPAETGGSTPPTVTVSPPTSGTNILSNTGSVEVDRDQNLFQGGFDASWELDVFGGTRRAVEAADADVAAAQEAERSVLVSLVAEVARNYVELLSFHNRLTIARDNIQSQQQTVELARARSTAGLTSELDVAQAEAQLHTTLTQVPRLEEAIKQSSHRLAVLLGQPPANLLEELSHEKPIPTGPDQVPTGLPSDLLRRRPDVRQAERELAAATARIGVATADLFPRFSLTGSFGLQSDEMRTFLDSRSMFWSVGPGVRWPIFEGGKIRANIEAQGVRQEQALARYEQTVLLALEDVENALVALSREQIRQRSWGRAVEANRKAVDLANELYVRGLTGFLSVLESQRSLYTSQDRLVESQATVVSNLIALYKALGGGWEVSATQ